MPLLLSHDVAGNGPPVLLLHSGVCDRRMWDPQWDALSRRFRAIRCDLRGFGDTPLPAERFSNIEDLSSLLDHEGIGETAVVGSSFGGRVALGFASTYPERVTALVLLCSALRDFPRTGDVDRFVREEDELLENERIDEAVALNVRTWLGTNPTSTSVACRCRRLSCPAAKTSSNSATSRSISTTSWWMPATSTFRGPGICRALSVRTR
jgi:3-oxoadipate enol-lactonase